MGCMCVRCGEVEDPLFWHLFETLSLLRPPSLSPVSDDGQGRAEGGEGGVCAERRVCAYFKVLDALGDSLQMCVSNIHQIFGVCLFRCSCAYDLVRTWLPSKAVGLSPLVTLTCQHSHSLSS